MKKLDINDFNMELKDNEYDKIIEKVKDLFLPLTDRIFNLYNIDCDKNNYSLIEKYFDDNNIYFSEFGIYSNLDALINYENNDDKYEYYSNSFKDRLLLVIGKYNFLVDYFNKYDQISLEISNSSYSDVLNDRRNKVIGKYIELLDYKNKKYELNEDLEYYSNLVKQYYNGFSYFIMEISELINSHRYMTLDYELLKPISLDDAQVILEIDKDLEEFNDYRDVGTWYRDYDLEDGETFDDLIEKHLNRLKDLFREMLSFRNVIVDSDNIFQLTSKIYEVYPFYIDVVKDVTITYNKNEIECLNSIDNIYDYLIKDYKNYDNRMKDYIEYLSEADNEFIDDDFL